MTQTEAKTIIDGAWSAMVELMATRGNQEARADIERLVKTEHRKEKLPLMLAKARTIETVLKGAARPTQGLATWRGIRVAHLEAAVIGAAYRDAIISRGHWDLESIIDAGEVFFKAWVAKDTL